VYTHARACAHTLTEPSPHTTQSHTPTHMRIHAYMCLHILTQKCVRACVCVYACVHVGVPRWLNAVLSERTIKCLAHGLAPCAQRCAAGERVSEAR